MSSGMVPPFRQTGATVAPVASSGGTAATLPAGGDSLLVTNGGSVIAFVRVGDNAAASVVDTPVLAGASVLLDIGPNTNSASVATLTSSATVYLTRGTGAVR